MEKENDIKSVVSKSRPTTFDELPHEQSRVEMYLSFLCGKIVDLDSLPHPQSRVEVFLNYLCHNGGIGGGGGQPLDTRTIIRAEMIDDTLIFTHLDNSVTQIPLTDFVKEWVDLEHVYGITKQNIFDPSQYVIKGSYYYNFNNDNVTPDNTGKWGRTVIPFVRGKIYTVYKSKHISQVFVFLDDTGQVVGSTRMSGTSMGGNKFSKRYRIDTNTAPQNAVAFGFNIVIDTNSNDYIDVNHEIMVFDEELTQTFNTLIPKTDGAEIVVDGNEVSIGFDPSGTNIMANTVNGALKYLDKQIFDAGISINNKVDITELSQTSQSNKVPQLGVDGKLHASMLPDLSINQVFTVQDQQGAMDLINNSTANIGDVFIIQGQDNAVYMYVDNTGQNFTDKCVELTLGTGVVKVVNDQFADATGRVTVRANHILLSDGVTNLENALNSKLTSINSVVGASGNIDLSIDKTSDNGIDFKVGNTSFGSVSYITDNQVQEIKDLFI